MYILMFQEFFIVFGSLGSGIATAYVIVRPFVPSIVNILDNNAHLWFRTTERILFRLGIIQSMRARNIIDFENADNNEYIVNPVRIPESFQVSGPEFIRSTLISVALLTITIVPVSTIIGVSLHLYRPHSLMIVAQTISNVIALPSAVNYLRGLGTTLLELAGTINIAETLGVDLVTLNHNLNSTLHTIRPLLNEQTSSDTNYIVPAVLGVTALNAIILCKGSRSDGKRKR